MSSNGGYLHSTVLLGFAVAAMLGQPAPAGATLDAFKCYKAGTASSAADFVARTVSLADEFETKTTSVRSPASICSPASQDGSVMIDATANLECYKIKDAAGQDAFASREVESTNVFGTERLQLKKAGQLCVPSEVEGQVSSLNLDSFKCYRASAARGATRFAAQQVLLDDGLDAAKTTSVLKPSTVCIPADQDGAGILDETASLECYKIKDAAGQPKFAAVDVDTESLFGTETLTAKKASLLCVPSTVSDDLSCHNSAITTYTYMMAFHQCETSCNMPQNHTVYLAGSNDGIAWSLIEEFAGFGGSVPALAFYGDFLYVFTPSAVVKVNACFEEVDSQSVALNSTEDLDGYVDASLIQSGSDLVMFYLPGISGMDPAGCSPYPCTKEIHSAVADDSTLASFTQITGDRISLEIASGSSATRTSSRERTERSCSTCRLARTRTRTRGAA